MVLIQNLLPDFQLCVRHIYVNFLCSTKIHNHSPINEKKTIINLVNQHLTLYRAIYKSIFFAAPKYLNIVK